MKTYGVKVKRAITDGWIVIDANRKFFLYKWQWFACRMDAEAAAKGMREWYRDYGYKEGWY